MPRPILALVLLGLTAGCGGGIGSRTPDGAASTPSQPQQSNVVTPRVITAGTETSLTMRVGETATLLVADPLAPDPEVSGTSVEVVDVANVAPAGHREWELRALEPGRTTIRSAGREAYVVTIDVADP